MVGNVNQETTLPEVLPSRHPEIEVAEFETEYVIFDPRCSEVHLIAGLTAVVFDACDGSTIVVDLVEEFRETLGLEFEASRSQIAEALRVLSGIGALDGTTPADRPP